MGEIAIEGGLELRFRVTVPVEQLGRVAPLIAAIGELLGAAHVEMDGATAREVAAPEAPALSEPAPRTEQPRRRGGRPGVPLKCAECGRGYASKEHKAHVGCPPHHWLVDALDGSEKVGATCKKCGARREDLDPNDPSLNRENWSKSSAAVFAKDEPRAASTNVVAVSKGKTPAKRCDRCGGHWRSREHLRDCLGRVA